jgi:hypothetical protein
MWSWKATQRVKATVIIAHALNRDNVLIKGITRKVDEYNRLSGQFLELCIDSVGNKSECRNSMAKKANGEILIFFDDDVELKDNTIVELLKPFDQYTKVGVVGGVNQAFPSASKMEKLGGALLANSLVTMRSSSRYTAKGDTRDSDEAEVLSCNMAVLKEAFVDAGGFPVDIIPCEENVLVNNIQKLGYRIIYTPFAMVYHRQPKLYSEYAMQIFGYGKGRGIMLRKGEGGPKMFHRINFDTFRLFVGYLIHVVSYVSGVIWGFLRGK